MSDLDRLEKLSADVTAAAVMLEEKGVVNIQQVGRLLAQLGRITQMQTQALRQVENYLL